METRDIEYLYRTMARFSQLSTIVLTVIASVIVISLIPVPVLGVNSFVSPATADGSFVLAQTGVQSQSTNASVTTGENETTRNEVVLTSVTLPHPGYIVVYEKNQSSFELTNKSVIGRTEYVRAGTFQDVVVSIDKSITNNTTIVVAIHNETNGNEAFDFVNQSGPDAAYQNQNGEPIVDTVRLGSVSTNQSPKSSQGRNGTQLPKQISLTGGYNSGSQSSTYRIVVTGQIGAANLSSNEEIENQNRIEGAVGYQESDVIYYSGYIDEFNSSGDITVTIGGREVTAEALGENRITLSRENSTSSPGSVQYQFSVSGVVVPGSTATNDTWFDDNTIAGELSPTDTTDTYYYTGNITQSSISESARIVINGQQVQVNADSNSSNNSASPGATRNGPAFGFRLSNITLNNQKIEVGQELAVNVTITNVKNGRLQTTIGLATAGTITDSKEITLFANGSQRVTFRYTYEAPGHYVVKIGVLNESGYVVAESKTTKSVDVVQQGALTPTATPTPKSAQQSSGSGPGFGMVVSTIAVVIVIAIARIRQ